MNASAKTCPYCYNYGKVNLPARFTRATIDRVPSAEVAARANFPCPACQPTVPIAQVYSVSVENNYIVREHPDYAQHMERDLAHTLAEFIYAKGYITYITAPAPGDKFMTQRKAVLGVVPPQALETATERIKRAQAKAIETVALRMEQAMMQELYAHPALATSLRTTMRSIATSTAINPPEEDAPHG